MVSENLKTASWFFFDLDDTLHEFRNASSAAVDAVLQLVIQQQATPERAPVTHMAQILDMYEKTLTAHLVLKPGVVSLLESLKQRGKCVAIVTEGPQDAQERAVTALGLTPYFDRLITTNAFGVAKVDGLFERALEALQIKGGDAVMVGDSWDRDVVPAGNAGIGCVWYAEKEGERELLRTSHVQSLGKR
ncbi:uncharacterized protein SETTUDRAFT_158854 [Exserohilum turcica Et28A]|uniref:Uncharacterized protein n=1 Tax=Exserohilum turcicum (strain 28A) TaxID=671987 RepID=R0KBE5_EXST2|nr:uncharacterized protein SETTUDRAFT_158854 [Exserohilum turcica Et28A]EOA90248.1 hypothetical protein SETTUDRAFT_158854 [Exserohilum turcica Et28A]